MTAIELLEQRFSNGIMIEIHSGDTLDIIEAMKEFAKYHVEQALKYASEEAVTINYGQDVSKDSILDAYPLENIK